MPHTGGFRMQKETPKLSRRKIAIVIKEQQLSFGHFNESGLF